MLLPGNALGMAVGQPVFATDPEGNATPAGSRFDQLGGLVTTSFRF